MRGKSFTPGAGVAANANRPRRGSGKADGTGEKNDSFVSLVVSVAHSDGAWAG